MRTRATAAVLALTLTGCASTSVTAAPAARTSTVTGTVETLRPGSLTARSISAAQTSFGLALMAKVCGTNGPNTLISPASAADGLGLLDAAAAGATRTGMAHLLRLPVWGPAVVAALHGHHADLAALGTGNGDTLRTSNRVWPAVGTTPTTTYLNDVRTAYDAQLRTLDFAHLANQATDVINAQVSKDTAGLIPRLLDQALSPTTDAVLTNAMVLKAKWASPFTDEQSKEAFTTAAGKSSPVTQMDSDAWSAYTVADGWQAAQIPYVSGTMAAVAILPPPSSKPCALPSQAQLAALTGASHDQTSVTLPRMHLQQEHDLSMPLAQLGLPRGGFSGIDPDFGVSQVIQKDVMSVDRFGTVAAAGTAVEGTGAVEPPKHHLEFDRPFLLMLEDTQTHTPLFLASVGDPSKP